MRWASTLQSLAVEAGAHIGDACSEPDACSCGQTNHPRSPSRTAASVAGSGQPSMHIGFAQPDFDHVVAALIADGVCHANWTPECLRDSFYPAHGWPGQDVCDPGIGKRQASPERISAQSADAVRSYLVGRGFDVSRIANEGAPRDHREDSTYGRASAWRSGPPASRPCPCGSGVPAGVLASAFGAV